MTSYEKGFLVGCLRAGISPCDAGRLFKQAQAARRGLALFTHDPIPQVPVLEDGWSDIGVMSPTFKESPAPISRPEQKGIELKFQKPFSLDLAKPASTLHQILSAIRYSKLEDVLTPEKISRHFNIPQEKVEYFMSQMPYNRLDSYTPAMLAELDTAGDEAIKAYQAEQESRKEVKKAPATRSAQPQQPQATQQAQLKQQKHQKLLDLANVVKKNQMKAFLRANKVPLLAGAGVLTAATAALLVNRMRKRRRAKKPAEVQ